MVPIFELFGKPLAIYPLMALIGISVPVFLLAILQKAWL